jgi:hypothetical protein
MKNVFSGIFEVFLEFYITGFLKRTISFLQNVNKLILINAYHLPEKMGKLN